MPELDPPAPADALRIEVEARQWWWRVRPAVPLANEIRLPVDERVGPVAASDTSLVR